MPKFNDKQIEQLKKEYSKIDKIDPSGPAYKKLTAMLNKMQPDQLKQLAGADVKFISPLARNRIKESLGETKVTKKELLDLEDDNEHGLVALKLAQAFGTPAEVKKIKDIIKSHEQRGHIDSKSQKERDAIAKKYWKMAEEVELDEAYKSGSLELNDGSKVKLSNDDANIINSLFNNLNGSNKKKMESKMMKDKKSFGEILAFAKETT